MPTDVRVPQDSHDPSAPMKNVVTKACCVLRTSIEALWQEDAAAPNPEHVHLRVRRRVHHRCVRRRRVPTLKIVHRDHVGA